MTPAIPVRCSTNWAMKPHIGSEVNLLSSYLPWGVKFGEGGRERPRYYTFETCSLSSKCKQFLKKPIAIDCSKIIETICYVTNTHPTYRPFIQRPKYTISCNYNTTRDGHKKFTSQQPSTRHKFTLRTYFFILTWCFVCYSTYPFKCNHWILKQLR